MPPRGRGRASVGRGRGSASRGGRGSRGSSAAAAPPQVRNEIRRVTITEFPEGHNPFDPIAHPGPEMVDAVRAALFEHEESRMIVIVTWVARDDDGDEEIDFHLRTTVLELLPAARSVSPEDHVLEVLRITAEKLKEKLESPHMLSTKLRIVRMKKVEFILVRGRRAQMMGPTFTHFPELEDPAGPPPPAPAQGSVGRGASSGLAVPDEVFRRRCCLKINNNDDHCFRYVLTAWKNGVPQKNAERISNYITNAPAGGRLPQLFKPEFVECGLDFSMLRFPVGIQDLEPFETANDVGIYVYEWHGSHAVPVRECI